MKSFRRKATGIFIAFLFFLPKRSRAFIYFSDQSLIGQCVRRLMGFHIGRLVFTPRLEYSMVYGNPGFYAGFLLGFLLEEGGWNFWLSLAPAGIYFIAKLALLICIISLAPLIKTVPVEIYSLVSTSLFYSPLGFLLGIYAKRLSKKKWPPLGTRYFGLCLGSWIVVGGTMAALETAYSIAVWKLDQGPPRYEEWLPPTERHFRIVRELDRLPKPHPWAGVYRHSGLFDNTKLALAPNAGFDYRREIDIGTAGHADGAVREVDGRLRLYGAVPAFEIKSDLVEVPWAERLYLIPEDHLLKFINEINGGDEPRCSSRGWFFLRDGDWEKSPVGHPQLPDRYKAYLLDKPVEAKIVSVDAELKSEDEESTYGDHLVTLDVGRRQGVLPGMEFSAQSQSGDAVVIEARERQSSARFKRFSKTDPLPQSGWQLSTQYPWNRGEGAHPFFPKCKQR